jgi:glycine oxidase
MQQSMQPMQQSMRRRSPDVIVIGAGIIGASIAWRLAQGGAAVTLLDAGVLGGEASWAGAGMLAPGGEIAERTAWVELALESLRLYPRFVEELEEEGGAGIDYRRCGALEIARTEAEWSELLRRREAQQSLGILSEVRDSALFYAEDAVVDPRDVTRALRTACLARRVTIREQTRVSEVRLSADRVEVETSAGPLAAAAAVLAAGAWSSEISVWRGGDRMEIAASFPVRGHLLGYTLEAGSMGPFLRHGHTYILQRASGFTIAGASSEMAGFDRRLDAGIMAEIHARACELWPRLGDGGEPQAWLGFRPATADYEPRIGRLGDTRMWLAYGHYRNGILLAPATAERISREIGTV